MTTTVAFHTDAVTALAGWEATLATPGLRDVLLAELTQRLIAAHGLPADRVTDARVRPPRHYAQLDGRTWVRYVVRELRVGVFGRTRRVLITGLVPQPSG